MRLCLHAISQNADMQTTYYAHLEKCLGVSEWKNDFDFPMLDNIDSHTDKLVVLRVYVFFLNATQCMFL